MHAYETVIGLEVHVQLATKSKIFSSDSAAFGGAPNTHTSAISLAHPGTLPRLNKTAVEYAVRLGLALDCEINTHSSFDRKNYFYADLPKGYQITQDQQPICMGGKIQLNTQDGASRTFRLHHIHLEEDAGKSMHDQDPKFSQIDLNRAGVPLLELVSEPDFRNAEEAASFMEAIRKLVRWLGISDGNMEEGSLRCDVNVSVRKKGAAKLGTRCEIKNINSMRFARRAIAFETKRQIEILENGGHIVQETRGFNTTDGSTHALREKEQAHDYRYFPEPDLPPVVITDRELEAIRTSMPPLPDVVKQELIHTYGLPEYDASQVTQNLETANYFRSLAQQAGPSPKLLANLLINKILPWHTEKGLALKACPVKPEQWREFVQLVETGQVSVSMANQRLFPALMEAPDNSPSALATTLQLIQTSDTALLEKMAAEIISRHPDKVLAYQKGKKGLIGMFMGELMKASKGKADPKVANQILREKLEK